MENEKEEKVSKKVSKNEPVPALAGILKSDVPYLLGEEAKSD